MVLGGKNIRRDGHMMIWFIRRIGFRQNGFRRSGFSTFLMHAELAAIAIADAVVAYSCMTNSPWVLA